MRAVLSFPCELCSASIEYKQYAPLPEALAAGVVVWVVLLAVRWAQVRGAVHSSPAACLRS